MMKETLLEILLFGLVSLMFLQANANSVASIKPLPLHSFRIKPNQQQASQSCLYTVVITTSCSSTSYTRDLISLSFGDAYGNQVYVPRLEDPSTRTFERCSVDTFEVQGPCAHQVCYAYLYRRGYDGWMPGTLQIYSRSQYYSSRPVTFTYNAFIPSNVWWGYNYCSRRVAA